MDISKLLDKPKVIAIVGDINSGKSMLLYHILEELTKQSTFNLYYYGLRLDFRSVNRYDYESKGQKSQRVYSIAEIESVTNSIVIIDEMCSLFDLENRKVKRTIENTLRLINHNNNILVLCGTPENFKKFISAKVNMIIFKKCSISDFINGSEVKRKLVAYNGYERGSEILNLKINEALMFDGQHYEKFGVTYYKHFDSKKDNKQILKKRFRIRPLKSANPVEKIKCAEIVQKKIINMEEK